MANLTINRCVWLLDTIRRYGRITRRELEDAWLRSPLSEGRPLSRRTFCNHRQMAEELFGCNIACDPSTFEYYIDDDGAVAGSVSEWLLDTATVNDVLSGARDIMRRISVEPVPSARHHLATIINALREHRPVQFDYHPFTRSLPTTGIVVEPYFLKLFKQRWYVVGRVPAEARVKTYALDRIVGATLLSTHFDDDPAFDIDGYFEHSYGIVVTHNEPRQVVLRVTPRRAKYLRALPFHHSQRETVVADDYSIFTYTMRVTEDFVAELLSHGPDITVVAPPELRAMVVDSLRRSLDNYADD